MSTLHLEKSHLLLMEALTQLIRKEILVSGGWISFARFMELALYAPGLGYYAAGQAKFGVAGDFVTAPEISPFFARTVALQFKQILEHTPGGNILEFGAGSGVFAKEVLLALEKLGCLPDSYFILEVSADLRDRQALLLQAECPHLMSRVQWLDSLPEAPFDGVIFANEVMDALPVHRFQIEQGMPNVLGVVWRENTFAWELREPSGELKEVLLSLHHRFHFEEGYQSEISLMLPAWVQTAGSLLGKGAIILFDYGYGRSEYYHPDRSMGTLMCYSRHQKHSDPLAYVGLQDITAHVDFTSVIEAADAVGCYLAGFTTQAGFLTACGLLSMAEQATYVSERERVSAAQAIKKLLLPSEMGVLVKVMGLTKGLDLPLLGFSWQDRSSELS